MAETEHVSKEPIAIIGLGCVLPDAPDVAAFWRNITEGKSSIREVPHERWDPALFWSADRDAPDMTYAKIGAFVADDAFSSLDYRMPPKVLEQIDPSQRWALSATRQAFKDAGYKTGLKGDEGKDFDRTRCAVILGNAMGGELMKLTTKRLYWPQVEQILRADAGFRQLSAAEQEAVLRRTEVAYKADTPAVTEDSMPGTLSNVAAGRIANLFDLAGKNFTTDAACASSLAALDAAIDSLRKGDSQMVVWGGTDRSMDITPYVEFSKIGALSADGSRPFDEGANGFVMGEGCAIFLLKRLSEAERDGDKVYAVVRGVGSSSDGKGKGITAPNPAGQVKAVMRAYQDAECDPFTVGYLEAHGTSTPVGDPVELTSVEEAFRSLSKTAVPTGSIAVGSVKSNMGHLKSAAGAVGLLKAALALHHKVLPPSINVRRLNPRIDWANSPFKVQTERTAWSAPAGRPRRAAVSSFGFGGTNFHVVLEEHVRGQLKAQPHAGSVTPQVASPAQPGATALDLAAFQAHMVTAATLEAEPLVLDGATAAQAAAQLAAARNDYAKTGGGPRLRDLLAPLTSTGVQGATRVGFSVATLDEVPKKLAQTKKAATDMAQARLAFQQGVFLGQGRPKGKVAFLFPGQGTQYVNMLRDLAAKYEVVRATFEEADRALLAELGGVRLTDILWPTPDTPEAQAASERKLQLTEYTQPAVLAADVALLRLLRQWGVEPDVVAGHSLGEYGALVAAGVLTFPDALHAVAARGREMAHVEVPDLGKMASVSADWATVQESLKGLTEYVIPANKNCPSQTVIAGSSKGVDQAVALLQGKGLQAQYLPVSAAFHSAIVAPASKPLRAVLSRLDVKDPKVRVLSNVGTEPYRDDPEWIRDNLALQVASPVEWIGIVERMHAEGVRVFVEVGPKLALTNFVRDILKAKPDAVAIGSNHPKKGGVAHANELFAFLGAWGFQPRTPDLADAAVYTASFRDPAARFRTEAAATAPAAVSPASTVSAPDPARQAMVELARSLRTYLEASPPTLAVPTSPASAPSASPAAADTSLADRMRAFGISLDDIGISGLSVGLPGIGHDLFDDGNWDRILRGENLIDVLPEPERRKMADKNIQRLVKGDGGAAQFQAVTDIAQVIQLAGRRGGFDLGDWGVQRELIDSLDRTFQYAMAAGLLALKDAGIPLQRTYQQTSQGTFLPKEWKLPEPLRDETGIVFASAFPGYDNLIRDVSRYLADKYAGRSLDELQALYGELIGAVQDDAQRDKLQAAFDHEFERLQDVLPGHGASRYEFNRKFLFNVLSMGHAQLAQLIGARGPNTQVNAACASSTQAVAIAEDWIRTGRARRVLVVGADDVTSDAMFEWIGAGF
ncbi:MAG TPA: beta-ketoacyl synthase N-terminal-like domain-containing protein, partial [Candidatus Thermoplasmatota archaeon]|nr:beta-ketoacyl synthase N-terminal-like domain-containing protein [Candidatus Thermoplasmatota archaeon]